MHGAGADLVPRVGSRLPDTLGAALFARAPFGSPLGWRSALGRTRGSAPVPPSVQASSASGTGGQEYASGWARRKRTARTNDWGVLGIGRRVRAAKNASRGEPAKRRNCQKSTRLPVYSTVPASPRFRGVFPRRGRALASRRSTRCPAPADGLCRWTRCWWTRPGWGDEGKRVTSGCRVRSVFASVDGHRRTQSGLRSGKA